MGQKQEKEERMGKGVRQCAGKVKETVECFVMKHIERPEHCKETEADQPGEYIMDCSIRDCRQRGLLHLKILLQKAVCRG